MVVAKISLFLLLFMTMTNAYGLSEREKKLDLIIKNSKKLNFHFYTTDKKKSFILMNNSFIEVERHFYLKKDGQIVPKDLNIPNEKVLKRLIEVARLKQSSIFIKNDSTFYFLDLQNNLIQILPLDYEKFFPPLTEDEILMEEALSQETKKKLLDKKREDLEKSLRKETALLPGWHKFKIDLAFKKIDSRGNTNVTNYFAFSPFYIFKETAIGLGLTLGGSMVRDFEETFFAFDMLLTAFTFYKMDKMTPALSMAVGKQTWIGMNESNTLIQIGSSLYFPAIFFIQEVFLHYAMISRAGALPNVSEIKLGFGLHL